MAAISHFGIDFGYFLLKIFSNNKMQETTIITCFIIEKSDVKVSCELDKQKIKKLFFGIFQNLNFFIPAEYAVPSISGHYFSGRLIRRRQTLELYRSRLKLERRWHE